jgi:hypothetical protein
VALGITGLRRHMHISRSPGDYAGDWNYGDRNYGDKLHLSPIRHRPSCALASLWRFGRRSLGGLVAPPGQKTGDRNVFVDCFPMQPKAADFDRLTLLPARIEEARKPSVGTPIVRPSDNSTHIESSSNLTALAETSIRDIPPCTLIARFLECSPPVARSDASRNVA